MALQNFGISPYFDDYSESDRYLKILFRPGFAVQARELNQLQTILQNQIQRFGNHVFENGSLVLNGETSLEKNQDYIRFDTPTNLLEITEDTSSFEGQVVRKRQFYSVDFTVVSGTLEAGQYVESAGRAFAGIIESVTGTTAIVKRVRGILSPSTLFAAAATDSQSVPNENVFVASVTVNSVTPTVSNEVGADTETNLTEATITRIEGVTSTGDPLTFYVAYSSGKGDTGQDVDTSVITFAKNDKLEVERPALVPNTRFSSFELDVEDSDIAIGQGVLLSINEGIYYLFGFFHLIEQQELLLKKYGTLEFNEVFSAGLYAEQELVTPEQDSDLLDNARGSTNFSAPGAHRYKVFPRFVNGADFADDENFVEVVKIERGEISKKVDRTFYSAIEDALARRTSEQSGDYVISEFDLQLLEHLDDGENGGYFPNNPENLDDGETVIDPSLIGDEEKLVALIGSGKAIVRGYESETFSDTPVVLDKARDTEQLDNVPVFLRQGSFVYVKDLVEVPFNASSEVVNLILRDGSSAQIGTAKLKAVTQEDTYNSGTEAYHRFYLFDIELTGTFSALRNIEIVSNNSAPNTTVPLTQESDLSLGINDFSVIDGEALLSRPADFDNTLIYELPVGTVDDSTPPVVENFELRFSDEEDSIQVAAGEFTVSFTDTSGARFKANPELYVLSEQDNNASGNNHKILVIPTNVANVITLSADGSSVTIDLNSVPGADLTQTRTYRIRTVVEKSTAELRTKTESSRTETVTVATATQKVIKLSEVDGIGITSVTFNGDDVTDFFTLDGGQRDTFYDHSALILNDDKDFFSVGDSLVVEYSFFQHSNTGQYFAADSYLNTGYEEIPVHETESGNSIPLANAIDFRPSINNASPSDEGFTAEAIFNPDSEINVTYNFFLGRIDKLVVTAKGELEILRGQPERQPVAPEDKEDSMNLYQFKIPPYTFDVSDIEVKKFDNRRFTMKDIGEIQNRVENLEYYTLLSLLEVDTVNKEFVDKFKSGFVVDNFETQEVGDGANPEHKIATDIENNLIRPIGETKNINLELDNLNSNDGIRISNNGEVVTLDYTESVTIAQPVASKLERITALLNFGWFGHATLSPSSDSWHSRRQRPDITLDGGVVETVRFTNNRDALGTVWNNWRTNWTGVVGQNTRTSSQTIAPARWVGNRLQSTVRTTRTTTTTTAVQQTRTGVVTTPITRTSVRQASNRLVSNTAIPFMRSRVISFDLKGMKPNSPLFLFMDGKEITGYVQEITRDGTREVFNSTSEPRLLTGVAGELTGKFLIPNTPSLKIRTGSKDVVFTDSTTGDDGSTEAKAKFTSTGRLLEYQRTFISTRIRDIDTSIVRDTRTLTSNRTSSTSTVNSRTLRVSNLPPSVRFNNLRLHHRQSITFRAVGGSTITMTGHMHGSFRVQRNGATVLTSGSRNRLSFSSGPLGETSTFTVSAIGRVHFHRVNIRVPVGFNAPARPRRRRRDPTAQSFLIDTQGGGFVTGLDIFLGEIPADNKFPITVQVRSMVNGYPGPEIMPFADIFVPASQLVGSSNATVPLHIDFDAPVYLEQDREYCFVVLSDSPALSIWSSKLGDIALPYVDPITGETKRNEQIVKQPNMGSLFRSQNNTTWNAVQEEDLKFNLYQAEFDITSSAQVALINRTNEDDAKVVELDPYYAELDEDGIETFEGSTYVKIHQFQHGLVADIDTVVFELGPDADINEFGTAINGIPVSEIFQSQGHAVVNNADTGDTLDPDYYYIEVSTAANNSSRPELPYDIEVNENVAFSQFYFKTDEVKLNGTDVNWTFSGNLRNSSRTSRTSPVSVISNDNYNLDNSFVSSKSSVLSGNNLVDGDVSFVGTLSSTKSNLTPVIDIEQVSVIATENKINEKKDDDNTSDGSKAAARYILKKVDLVNPADQLRVYLDTNVPPGASVELFYRVKPEGSSVLLEDTAWEKVNPVEGIIVTEDENNFSESEYRVEDINENFTSFNLKIVFSSPAKHRVPRVKNLRAIALKDNPNI